VEFLKVEGFRVQRGFLVTYGGSFRRKQARKRRRRGTIQIKMRRCDHWPASFMNLRRRHEQCRGYEKK
jgi:hypothetical protein